MDLPIFRWMRGEMETLGAVAVATGDGDALPIIGALIAERENLPEPPVAGLQRLVTAGVIWLEREQITYSQLGEGRGMIDE